MENSLMGTQLGNYVVGVQLDEGGMGAIYRAFKPNSNDPFVVKVLLPEYTTELHFRKRFEREVMLLQGLNHPHIIPIVDFGEQDDMLYFVMPFIRGFSLANMLPKQHFSPATAWMILEPIAQALDYAHQQRVIHRDLKPGNILVESGETGSTKATRPYLADFGLSKPVDRSSLTQTGIAIGTPQYMAPEQVRAQPVTSATDVYALGIVIYEMLLGRVPFPNGDPDIIALKQMREMPPAPHTLNPDFPLALEAVILKALAKAPGDRYETAGAFSAAYWQAIQGVSLQERMHYYGDK